jgi:hypothetical protein
VAPSSAVNPGPVGGIYLPDPTVASIMGDSSGLPGTMYFFVTKSTLERASKNFEPLWQGEHFDSRILPALTATSFCAGMKIPARRVFPGLIGCDKPAISKKVHDTATQMCPKPLAWSCEWTDSIVDIRKISIV